MSDEPRSIGKLPPLPPVPPPPVLAPDPRQRRTRQIIGNIQGQLGGQAHVVGGPPGGSGFAASAVDLGRLQAAMEAGLQRFTMMQVRARWDDDVQRWLMAVVETWVQRLKELRITLADNGVHVELQTQDDLGYYRYTFDVFPGSERSGPRGGGG